MENKHIKKIPYFWRYLPFLHVKMASTIYPNIYFPENEYLDLNSSNPSFWIQSVLIHEKVHLEVQKEIGLAKFGFFYLISKKFRLEQELLAIEKQMKFLKEKSAAYDVDRKAKQFSGKEYMYLMDFSKAQDTLTKLWNSQ